MAANREEPRPATSAEGETVSRLAGGVAHELNNILTVIRTYAEMAHMHASGNARVQEELREIELAGDRGVDLARKLRVISGAEVLALNALNLNDFLAGTTPVIQGAAGDQIRVEVRLDPDLPEILADLSFMEVIFINLAEYARDTMPDGGSLSVETVRLKNAGGTVCDVSAGIADMGVGITIRQSGRGVEPEFMERVFEPFFPTKLRGKGAGLGLATVQALIRQHGGSISADIGDDGGMKFHVYLPAKKPGKYSRPGPGPGEKRVTHTVLLVEDDPAVCTLVEKVLQMQGYAVMVAHGPEEALSLADTAVVDLLLSDVVLPGTSGLQLHELVRAIHPNVKVVFMSGYADDVLSKHGLLLNDENLLPKPFRIVNLTEKVRNALT